MRALDPDFAAHIAGGATTLCYCWRITRRDGVIYGFSDHDKVLSFDGTDFVPESGAQGAAISASADLAVDNTALTGALSSSLLSSSLLSAQDLAGGRYDGARVEIWRVNWAAPAQRLLMKAGVIGEITRTGDAFSAEMRGPAHALDQETGRVYQRQCDAQLGDGRCGVVLSSPLYQANGTVLAVADESRITVSGLSDYEDGWFAHGVLSWTSGANAGTSFEVKTQGRANLGAGAAGPGPNGSAGDQAALSLWLPAPMPMAAGDMFTLTAGCDKTHGACREKFNNLINFRGFHLMPGNDFVVRYPARDDVNDGGTLS